jgi:hypothetical protein
MLIKSRILPPKNRLCNVHHPGSSLNMLGSKGKFFGRRYNLYIFGSSFADIWHVGGKCSQLRWLQASELNHLLMASNILEWYIQAPIIILHAFESLSRISQNELH